MGNYVILTGSPRKNGNSAAMADMVTAELVKHGIDVMRFDTAFMNIEGCRDCRRCYTDGKPCVADDDFAQIAVALEEAEGVIIATPLYWYSFPAQLKAVIDKFVALYGSKRLFSGKKCILLACCGDAEPDIFDGMVFAYRKTVELMQGENAGEILVSGIYPPGTVRDTDAEKQIHALVKKLSRNDL